MNERPQHAPQPEIGADETLPDLLRPGLDIVFVGINPSVYSVERGHYFARRTNRFWPCFSRSVLSAAARAALGVAQLAPEHDSAVLDHGFGFTDVVKRATANVRGLAPGELAAAVPLLVAKMERYQPRIACFHGVTGYERVHETLPGAPPTRPSLGKQAAQLGRTRIFLVPNPSPANAHFTPADQTGWYDALARYLGEIG